MRRLLLIAALLIGGPVIACAQPVGATLTGTVRDAETGAPLPGVNVFLAETTLGTATDARGRFVIEHVPLGQHRLYASMVGYEAAARDTLLRRTRRPYVVHVRLTPDVLALEGVTVEAERDRRWQRRLRRFERHFLGASANADSTRLLNPEVLRFDATWWGKLEVSAAAPLVVENRALGYRIRYFLEEFETTGTRTQWDGEPLFEPLVPEDSAQAARWRARREHAYRGSLRHFLRALRAGHVREAGFTMRLHRRDPFGRRGGGYDRRGRRVDARRLVEARTDTSFTLRFRRRLAVTYHDEEAEPAFARSEYRLENYSPEIQVSYLELEDGAARVDRTGAFVDPYAAIQYGYFAFERLADAVPKNYRPASPAE